MAIPTQVLVTPYLSPIEYIACQTPESLPPDSEGPIIQINGRKVFGPPPNWKGPPPSNGCELFIRKIPRHIAQPELQLLPHLQRFGPIYQFRIMMEFHGGNRGFGFVRYTNETDAKRAKEVLNHFYVAPKRLLEVERSYDKCRLFVGNIPKDLSRIEIEQSFRKLFPSMERIIMLNRISDGYRNRGFVFIDFRNHQDALEVKKQVCPGSIRMWERNLKIVWANPERTVDDDSLRELKTLFVRNIDLSISTKALYELITPIVKRDDILRISRVREYAFITFVSRAVAETALLNLQGVDLQGHSLHLEWALPAPSDSVHSMKDCDFDALLRMKCIANYWTIPVIIFGRLYETDQIQYAAIMIKSNRQVHAFFFEIYTNDLTDIQSRLCEVVVNLIQKCGAIPIHNYVIKIRGDSAYIVGTINLTNLSFIKAVAIPKSMFLYHDEVTILASAIARLSQIAEDELLLQSRKAQQNPLWHFIEGYFHGDRLIASLNPNYRRRRPLKYDLDNHQIVLVVCSAFSFTNYWYPTTGPAICNLCEVDGPNQFVLGAVPYAVLNLMPNHFAQSDGVPVVIKAIRFG